MSRRRLTLVTGLAILAALALLLPAPALAQTTQVVEYYHTDALGSVRAVTNQQGQVIRRHDFLPFGEELQPTVPPPDKPLFTGKERDAETGLDYFGARYQRASVGRFTTVDPLMTLEQNLADPQRWNRYTYARTNPLRWVDPTGMYIASCGNGVRNCGGEIQDFDKARRDALKSKDPAVRAAAAAYGVLGDDNGVSLSIVTVVDPTEPSVAGTVTSQAGTGGMRYEDGGMIQATQVAVRAGLSGVDLSAVLIHEGVHVGDRAAFIASIDVKADTWNPALNITALQSERNAFGVENLYRRSIGAASRDINRILAGRPYSTNPTINQPLFPILVR